MSFAYWLKYYRNKANYTQNEIAKELGMTRQNYSRYENENLKAYPSLDNLCKLAYLLKTDPNSLVGFQPQIDEMEYAEKNLDNIVVRKNYVLYHIGFEHNDTFKEEDIQIPKKEFLKIVSMARTDTEICIDTQLEASRPALFHKFCDYIINDWLNEKKVKKRP